MFPKSIRTIIYAASFFLIVMGQLWILIGHEYRYPFKEQFLSWNDGLHDYIYPKDYLISQRQFDTFSPELYNKIHSVQDAVDYIKNHYKPKNEEETARAVFDVVSKRFIDYDYPHFTIITNPFLHFVEILFPKKPFNKMYLADDVLRHSAAAPCHLASTTFIEIFRKLGHKAQFVSLQGHSVVEAEINKKKWMIDANAEVLSPYSVEEMHRNPDLVHSTYSKLANQGADYYLRAFADPDFEFRGLEGAPTSSPNNYKAQKIISFLKWIAFPTLFVILLVNVFRRPRP
jgi:hypothetical protein